MYIGSTSLSGLHHLVYEIVDNSIDEALAGFCTGITVTIEEGDIICVCDNGRGIPVDIQEQTGKARLRSCSQYCTRAASSAAGDIRSPAVCTVSARRSSTLSVPSGSKCRYTGTAKIYQMKFSRGGITGA